MIVTKKNRINTNIERLNEFFELLSEAAGFLQSDKLFNIRSILQNSLTGMIYQQSWEVLCNHNTRSINSYFKGWVDDEDCTVSIIDHLQPNLPLLIVPSEYADKFPSVLVANKTIELESHYYVDDQECYIDLSYYNAEYHFAMYSMVNYLLNFLINDVSSTKFQLPIIREYYNDFFSDQINTYKNRLIRFGLLSNNPQVQERAKMILTASEMLACDNSYIKEHHCRVRLYSEVFAHGGNDPDKAISVSMKHIDGLINEVRNIHNPLFEKFGAL